MGTRGGALVGEWGGGVIGAKWWWVGLSPGVLRWFGGPGVVGTYKLLFCSKRNAASMVVTCEVVVTLNHYKMVKKV